ncbi:hypothetical protein J5X84_06700 [Streptosporangiaceae bacterium NEAU-GS5]|nr:hypothetical protein [Streptosporangiaceae bacterium NEAU-GS5]
MKIRRIAVLLGAAALLTETALSAPASAATIQTERARSPISVDCGWVTCSLYFSRPLTRRMATPLGAIAVLTGKCSHPACKAVSAASALLALKAGEAARKHQCLRIRFIPPAQVVGLYSSGNKHCHS